MRFRELQLIRYGRFESCVLPFEDGDCDLQLVIGPNEAGKSTTLEAVGDLLFGFPHVTRFAFRFDRQLLRVGAVIEHEGSSFEVRRRKGNAQTLLGADDQPIEPGLLAAALGAQTRESFERMFGLDHQRLRSGGQAILDARDDVGQAIFAAGSGLLRVSQVCEALEQEAKGIWTSRAGESRTYTAAARAWQEARGRLREAQVRPAAWALARRALDDAETQLRGLRERRVELEGQTRALERRRRTLAPLARRQAVIEQLAAIGDAPEVAADALERFEAGQAAHRQAGLDLDRAITTIAELDTARLAAQPDRIALAAGDEIEALREAKGVMELSREALPRLRADCDARLARAAALQREIGWPDEPPGTTKARLPGRPALAELRDLLERRSGLDRQSEVGRDALDEATASLEDLRAQLAKLPPGIDLQPLQARLRALRDEGDAAGPALSAASLQQELESVLADRLAALAPWSGDISDLRGLVLPANEDVERALDRLSRAEGGVETERTALTTDLERLDQLRLERVQAARAHLAPDHEALQTARRDRDAAWAPLKAHILEGSHPAEPQPAVDDYARLVAGADHVVDLRFDQAEHAGRLAGLDREIEKADLRLNQSTARLAAAELELANAAQGFDDLVSGLGVPLSAAAYEGWRDARASALEAANALVAATRDLDAAREREAGARRSILEVLGEAAAAGGSTLRALFAEAERRLEAGGALVTQRRTLEAQIETAEAAVQRAQRQARAVTDALDTWSAVWVPALARLSLAADAGLAGVRSRLDLIETLRGELDDILALQGRISEAERIAADFAGAVNKVATDLGQTSGADAGETLACLVELTATAATQERRALDLDTRLEAASAQKDHAEAAIARAQAVLDPFLGLAPEGSPETIRAVIVRALEATRLRGELRSAEGEILALGDGLGLPELMAAAADSDPDTLATEAAALAEDLRTLNAAVEAASAAREVAELAFKALDDRPDAAIAAFEMAEARSEMAFQAELYIRKRAETKLLRAAIDRYRAEKQAPLLSRASELFGTLTLGRYQRLLVEYDGDAPRLAGLRSDGATVVPVDGMSQGTVDQLFLALRVAAVEDAVAQGARLPFLADDLFINFDDARAAAGFQVLAELARRTQVLFFTHHEHLLDVATKALHRAKIVACHLPPDVSAVAL